MPTFGHSIGSNGDPVAVENVIYASPATTIEVGEAHSITARIQVTTAAKNIRCALYKVSDGSYLSETIEKTVQVQASATEVEFFFDTKPRLEADTAYYICIWSSGAGGTTFLLTKADTGVDSVTDNRNYNGFPSVFTVDTTESDISADIYCTYTQTLTGSKGTRAVATRYPVTEGITARTTRARSEGRFLTPEQSFIREKDKVGIY